MVTGLAQLELTLHHHMDSCFGSLSRLIIDKNDSTSDQMIRRFEALDDNVEQGIRDLNGSASGLKKDINSLINATKDVMRRLWVMQEHSRELELRLELLEKAARGGNTRYDSYASTTSVREPRTMSPQPSQSVHRRTGSAIEPSIRDESLNEGHPSVYGSRGFRSYTTSSAGPEVGEVRKVKKQLYTEPGAAKGPPPDLDDHTAVMEYEPPSTKNEDVRRMIEAGLNDPEGQIYSRGYRDGGWYESLYGKQKKENLEKP